MMATNSKIEWTHHTFNPWRGCTKVSAGCAHCYAEAQAVRNPRVLGIWGDHGTRPVAAESYWKQPLAWDRAAKAAGERHRVFCASLADVFEDRPELAEPRGRLLELIQQTEHLDWLLLTKRPENIVRLWDAAATTGMVYPMPNVWLGTSCENQAAADERRPYLLGCPAAVRFLSIEPLLGPIDLVGDGDPSHLPWDWVIVGGESGPDARPCNVEWVRGIVGQCEAAGVACFVKQLGSMPVDSSGASLSGRFQLRVRDRKGGNPDEWAADLRVRQFPSPS